MHLNRIEFINNNNNNNANNLDYIYFITVSLNNFLMD